MLLLDAACMMISKPSYPVAFLTRPDLRPAPDSFSTFGVSATSGGSTGPPRPLPRGALRLAVGADSGAAGAVGDTEVDTGVGVRVVAVVVVVVGIDLALRAVAAAGVVVAVEAEGGLGARVGAVLVAGTGFALRFLAGVALDDAVVVALVEVVAGAFGAVKTNPLAGNRTGDGGVGMGCCAAWVVGAASGSGVEVVSCWAVGTCTGSAPKVDSACGSGS